MSLVLRLAELGYTRVLRNRPASLAKVGEITKDNDLLYAKTDKLEGGRPLVRRRSKK
jgi:hypothetical protein